MTDIDPRDTAPGKGDPTRSDDNDSPGLRSDHAGSGMSDPSGPAGTAGGGYGTDSLTSSSTGTPDGEDVQVQSGPGPQTDWLRSASGKGVDRSGARAGERAEDREDALTHEDRADLEGQPERQLTVDDREVRRGKPTP